MPAIKYKIAQNIFQREQDSYYKNDDNKVARSF